MKVKKILVWIIVIILVVGGGFLVYKYAFKENKNTSSKGRDSDNPPPNNPNGKLTQAELEKYLLEKRLDLQKYFVFNLGELGGEIEFGVDGGRKLKTREIKETGSLRRHLSDLTNGVKGFVKLDKRNDPEWNGERLSQKIREGQIYIVFDKKLPESGENWFGGVPMTNKNTNEKILIIFSIDLLSPKVNVFPTKKETLGFLRKNDPLLKT